jgi:hypothetical protein
MSGGARSVFGTGANSDPAGGGGGASGAGLTTLVGAGDAGAGLALDGGALEAVSGTALDSVVAGGGGEGEAFVTP